MLKHLFVVFATVLVGCGGASPSDIKVQNPKDAWYEERIAGKDRWEVGPQIGPGRMLAAGHVQSYAFTGDGDFAVYAVAKSVFMKALRPAEIQPAEIASFDGDVVQVHSVNKSSDVLVQEECPGRPTRLWWVRSQSKKRKLLVESDAVRLADAPACPIGRFVAFHQSPEPAGGTPGRGRLCILDRISGGVKNVRLVGNDLSLVRWTSTPAGDRAVVVRNQWPSSNDAKADVYWVNPETGLAEAQLNLDDGHSETNSIISPDERCRAILSKTQVEIINLGTGEHACFTLALEDQRFVGPACLRWIDSSALQFNGSKLGLINVYGKLRMMNPTPVASSKVDPRTYRFAPLGGGSVMYSGVGEKGVGLYLAPVRWPSNPS